VNLVKNCKVHGQLTLEQCYPRKGYFSCRLCRQEKNRIYGALPKKKEYRKKNKEHIKKKNKEYYFLNREKALLLAKAYQLKTKLEVLSHYSDGTPTCKHCGEKNIKFLCLDHVEGGGKEHKRQIGGSGGFVYLWARKNNYLPVFQVLCHNCNTRKGSSTIKSENKYHLNIKLEVLNKYSDSNILKCVQCGESDLRVLTIDHIDDNGAEHRRSLQGKSFYLHLHRSKKIHGLQVSCQNHNLGKRCLG